MKLFDLHCDTLYECYEAGKHLRENDLHINREAVRKYDHYAQFFALFCGTYPETKQENRKYLMDIPADERFGQMVKTAEKEFAANSDWLFFCKSAEDFETAQAQKKAAAFLSIEGAELLPDRDDAIDVAYDAGIRCITVTWNYRSRFGCSAALNEKEGLTEQGKKLVRDASDKGIILDVSHLSEQGFWDLCGQTDKPFIASHSNARAMYNHSRNLTDEQFVEIVRRKGLVGINLYVPFLVHQSDCTLDDVIDHIEHFLGMYGENHVALGADFDGCDVLPRGINGAFDMDKLADKMLQKGYKESTVQALFYNNAAAFIKKML